MDQSTRENVYFFFSIVLPCVFLKGVFLTLTKRNYSLGDRNTVSATVSLSKIELFFTLLPGLKPSSNQKRFREYYDRAESHDIPKLLESMSPEIYRVFSLTWPASMQIY